MDCTSELPVCGSDRKALTTLQVSQRPAVRSWSSCLPQLSLSVLLNEWTHARVLGIVIMTEVVKCSPGCWPPGPCIGGSHADHYEGSLGLPNLKNQKSKVPPNPELSESQHETTSKKVNISFHLASCRCTKYVT